MSRGNPLLVSWSTKKRTGWGFGFDLHRDELERLRAAGGELAEVVGGRYHSDSLQGDRFAVGAEVVLVDEPDNPRDAQPRSSATSRALSRKEESKLWLSRFRADSGC